MMQRLLPNTIKHIEAVATIMVMANQFTKKWVKDNFLIRKVKSVHLKLTKPISDHQLVCFWYDNYLDTKNSVNEEHKETEKAKCRC